MEAECVDAFFLLNALRKENAERKLTRNQMQADGYREPVFAKGM